MRELIYLTTIFFLKSGFVLCQMDNTSILNLKQDSHGSKASLKAFAQNHRFVFPFLKGIP